MEQLVAAFRRFAKQEAKNNSPLYEYWCEKIMTNDQLLNLIMHIPEIQSLIYFWICPVFISPKRNPSKKNIRKSF